MEFESIVKLNDEFGIKLPNYTLGNYKRTCPQCSHTRRKKDEQCLSVTIEVDHVKFNCHHCEFNGGFKTTKNVSYIHNKNNINKKVIDEMDTFDINNPIWDAYSQIIEAATNVPLARLYIF